MHRYRPGLRQAILDIDRDEVLARAAARQVARAVTVHCPTCGW
jgi:hypothetical protein